MALIDVSAGIVVYMTENQMEWTINIAGEKMISPDFTINKIKSKLMLINNQRYYNAVGQKQFVIHLLLSSEAAFTIEKVDMTFYRNDTKISSSQKYEFFNPLFSIITWHCEISNGYNRNTYRPHRNSSLEEVIQVVIQCQFFFKTTQLVSVTLQEPSICEYYEKLFYSGKFSDMTIHVSDTEFKVHKSILSTRSKVFCAMLEDHTKETRENKIEITDINANLMQEILRFIYAGKVVGIKKIVFDLVPPADKYELHDLLTLCQKTIIKDISSKNLKQILTLLNYIELNLLKNRTLYFIINNRQLLKTKDFTDFLKKLSPSLLTEIIAVL